MDSSELLLTLGCLMGHWLPLVFVLVTWTSQRAGNWSLDASNGSSPWNGGGNPASGIPATGDTINVNHAVAGDTNLSGLLIQGTGVLTIGGNRYMNDTSVTVSCAMVLGAGCVLSVSNNKTLTISGALSGTGYLYDAGSGANIIISATGNWTQQSGCRLYWAGTVTVQAGGTWNIQGGAQLLAAASSAAIVRNPGAIVTLFNQQAFAAGDSTDPGIANVRLTTPYKINQSSLSGTMPPGGILINPGLSGGLR